MEYLWSKEITPPIFSTLDGDKNTSVLVIGGGMVGILCAYMLHKKGVDCILVEAEKIGNGTTKGTTAVLTAQHDILYKDMVNKWGTEKSRKYLHANLKAVKQFFDLSQNIQCDFEIKASHIYSRNKNDAEILKHEVDIVNKLGFSAEYVSQSGLPFSIVGAARYPGMAQFHPLKFLYGLARELNIYENTMVTRVANGVAYTDKGNIKADKIVVATHFPFINRRGLYFVKLYQKRSFVLALENGPNIMGTYVDYSKHGMYFRNYNNLLLVGGGDHRTGAPKGGFDSVEEYVKEYFPEYNIKYRWAAQDCISLDNVAYIGRYSPSLQDVFVATGFNEWGMTTSMIAAEIISDMVVGKTNEYSDVFLPNRSVLSSQLLINLGETIYNYLIPTTKRCSHMGCALRWNGAEHTWDCACHGSRFNEKGKLINNPAMKNVNGNLNNRKG